MKVKKALFLLPLIIFLASCATDPVVMQDQRALSIANSVFIDVNSKMAKFANSSDILYYDRIADINVNYNYDTYFKPMPYKYINLVSDLQLKDINVNDQEVIADCVYGNVEFKIVFPIADFVYFSNLPDCSPISLKHQAGYFLYYDPKSSQAPTSYVNIYATDWPYVSKLLNNCKKERNPLTNKNYEYFKFLLSNKMDISRQRYLKTILINTVMFGYVSNIQVNAQQEVLQKINSLKSRIGKIYILQNPITEIFTKLHVVENDDSAKTLLAIIAYGENK